MIVNENDKILVVIPAISCACSQIESVQSQLRKNNKLNVVWNGSISSDCCKKKVSENSSSNWIEAPPYIGASKARNLGVMSCKENVKAILFCDSDDIVADNWLLKLSQPLITNTADIVGGALCTKCNKNEGYVLPGEDYNYKQAVFGGNCGMTLDAWSKLNGFDEKLLCCEDTDIAWRGAHEGLRLRIVSDAIVTVALKNWYTEIFQRFNWGYWAVKLLLKHEVSLFYLPSLCTLIRHISTNNFASNPYSASLAQFSGYCFGRFISGK